MKLVATLVVIATGAVTLQAPAQPADAYAQRTAEDAARSIWRRTLEENLSAAAVLYDGCIRRSSASIIGLCVTRYTNDIDSVLSDSYETSVRVDATSPAALRKAHTAAQAAWMKYRDAQCDAVKATYEATNGAGAFAEQGCRAHLTIIRVREIASLPGE